jgi:cold shock CspA family protein
MEGKLKFVDEGTQHGYVALSDGSKDLLFHMTAVTGPRPSKGDIGAGVEFDLVKDERGRRAENLRLLGPPSPLGVATAASPVMRPIYFNSALLGEPDYDYVCWLDVMGTRNQMLRSLPISASFIFKLHCGILEAAEEVGLDNGDVRLYPVMDGAYITSSHRAPLQGLLNRAMAHLALTFLSETVPYHQFLVRGAIAFGPVYHGRNLDPKSSHVMRRNEAVRNSMLMGLPMVQANQSESDAPPFGIAIHESARAFAPAGDEPFAFIWIDWLKSAAPRVEPAELSTHLDKYFAWQKNHSTVTGYAPDRIEHHHTLAREYFAVAVERTGGASHL